MGNCLFPDAIYLPFLQGTYTFSFLMYSCNGDNYVPTVFTKWNAPKEEEQRAQACKPWAQLFHVLENPEPKC